MEGITLSDNGIATWPAISTAGSYEVRVYRRRKDDVGNFFGDQYQFR